MAELSIKNIGVVLADNDVLKDVSLTIESGEIVCLLGQSGSGKSTLLRALAGLQQISQGEIYLDGQLIADKNCQKSSNMQDIGMIFQDYALFPHMTVKQNIGFSLAKLASKARADKIQQVITMMNLDGLEQRKPSELSGGQQQRVSIARSLVCEPKVLLFDEPFSNLDKQVKQSIITSVKQLLKAQNMTSIFVTHDRDEAFMLADKIAIIEQGEIAQFDTPEHLYQKPATQWIASSLGHCLLLELEKQGDDWQTVLGQVTAAQLQTIPHWLKEQKGVIALRPHHYVLSADDHGQAEVVAKTFLGVATQYDIRFNNQLFNVISDVNYTVGQMFTILLNLD